MKYTNKHRIPEVMVRVLINDEYSKGDADISVTGLLSPPQMRHLMEKHDDEIVVDVSDLIYSLQGKSVHHLAEVAAGGDYNMLTEKSIYSQYLGWKIKGQFDHVLLGEGLLLDFKTCSSHKVSNGAVPEEWVQQTNIYKRLLQKEVGLTISQIQVCAIVKDYSKHAAQTKQGYPPAPIFVLDIPVWEDDAIDAFIEERVRLHQQEEPPACTDKDRWARDEKWAVMKRGNVRALRLFDNPFEAEQFASTSAALYVEHRPGDLIRCQDWCHAAPFCKQWQEEPRNTRKQMVEEILFNAKV